MRGVHQWRKRQAFYGWIKWLPVVSIPFAVMFVDAWLNIATWEMDYEYGRISRHLRVLESELVAIRTQEKAMARYDRLDESAEALALVKPSPQQIRTIRPHSDLLIMPEAPDMMVATHPAPPVQAAPPGEVIEPLWLGAPPSEVSAAASFELLAPEPLAATPPAQGPALHPAGRAALAEVTSDRPLDTLANAIEHVMETL